MNIFFHIFLIPFVAFIISEFLVCYFLCYKSWLKGSVDTIKIRLKKQELINIYRINPSRWKIIEDIFSYKSIFSLPVIVYLENEEKKDFNYFEATAYQIQTSFLTFLWLCFQFKLFSKREKLSEKNKNLAKMLESVQSDINKLKNQAETEYSVGQKEFLDTLKRLSKNERREG